ncbi:uncharacterized protein COLE_05171 [Cutaneotrichosporon oleaginosum]|uniref:uncharacterized protein n=1 Tax=Cutaneotrichosporon oleaginosum TaxID=879819 RepID=UPI00132AEFAE|nr:hypothetical protein COLE_05171 [Cutaneotrichosporon oleaginosum]
MACQQIPLCPIPTFTRTPSSVPSTASCLAARCGVALSCSTRSIGGAQRICVQRFERSRQTAASNLGMSIGGTRPSTRFRTRAQLRDFQTRLSPTRTLTQTRCRPIRPLE